MSKEAVLPDGTILEFPDETPDDVMDRAVRGHLGRQTARDVRSSVRSAARPRQSYRRIEDAATRGSFTDPLENSARAYRGENTPELEARRTRLRDLENAPDLSAHDGTPMGRLTQHLNRNRWEREQARIQREAAGAPSPVPTGPVSGEGVIPSRLSSALDGPILSTGLAGLLALNDLTDGGAGAYGRGVVRSAAPTAAGAAAFGPGFTVGAGLGSLGGPVAPFTVPAGGLVFGLLSALGASYATNEAQEAAFDRVPDEYLSIIGQTDEQRAQDQADHPYYSFAGELSPQFLFMRPGLSSTPVREGASRLERFLANPVGGAAVGGTIGGATEGGRQLASGEDTDWTRILMSIGAGAAGNRPTQLGQRVFDVGVGATVAGMQRAARAAGETAGRFRRAPEPNFDTMRRAGSSSTATNDNQALLPAPRAAEPPSPAAAPPRPPAPPSQAPQPAPSPAVAAPVAGAARPVIDPAVRAASNEDIQRRIDEIESAAGEADRMASAPRDEAATQLAARAAEAGAFTPEEIESAWRRAGVIAAQAGFDRINRVHFAEALSYEPRHAIPADDAPQGEPQQRPSSLPDPGPLADGEAYVSTASGDRVRTRMEVVDARDLTAASGDLQPRDRTRASSDVQVQDIIGKFDPSRLGSSAEADRGAPIVGPDGVIESGNARTMALSRIHESYPEQAAAYRRFIEQQGLSTEGVERPVLIRRRVSDLDDAQRRQFVVDANRSAILEMTPTERARADADILDGDTLALYRGGDIGAAGNRDFVRAFQSRLPASEQGALIDSQGVLNQAGIRRVESALMARAYENPEVLEKLLEARDNNIRSIGGAMLDNSGAWGRLRAGVASGEIQPRFDVTDRLVEAARIVSDARAGGTKIGDLLSQQGMFGNIDPITERFIRAFYDPKLGRAMGRAPISRFIEGYVRRASEQTTAPRLVGGEETTPEAIMDALLAERDRPGGDLFGTDGETLAAAEDRAPRVRRGVVADRSGPVGPIATSRDLAAALDRGVEQAKASAGPDDDAPAPTKIVTDPVLDRLEGGSAPNYGHVDPPLAHEAGPYDPEFLQKSFTSRESIYDTAAVAAGYEPAEFRLLPGPKQIAELTRTMKETFGVTVKVKPGMQDRFAIDQLLDAYQNVQGMAYALGLPAKAISLGGGLQLQLQKKGRFLGAYAPGKETILLPGRSNSFAHEWGHALDFYLLKVANDGFGAGFSGAIRQRGDQMNGGGLPPSNNVREAFVDLLNAMFFDEAALAARVLDLEKKLAAARTEGSRARIRQQIDRVLAGASQTRAGRTVFYRNAKAMDGPGEEGAKVYWSSPTEMLARSFEAYVSNRVEARGFTTEFIGKGDQAYLSDADERFAKTFPKGTERDAIFAAYDVLFDRIAAAELLGSGAPYPPKTLTSSRAQLFQPPVLPKTSWFVRTIGNEMSAWEDFFIRRAKAAEGRPNNPKGYLQRLQDVGSFFAYGMTARWKMLGRRYQSPTIQRLHDMLTHNTGSGKFTPRGLIHATRLRENQYVNRLDRALERHVFPNVGRRVLNAEETRQLRDLLISENVRGAKSFIVKLAAELRRLEDEIFYDLQRAGIDVGYTRNGHLQRMVDVPKVLNDEAGFLAKAAEVYDLVFAREWGEPGDVLDGDSLTKFLRMARQLQQRGHAVDIKPVTKIIRRLNAAIEAGDDAAAAAAQASLEEAFASLYDAARSAFALQAADDWLLRISSAAPDEFDRTGPDAAFTKKRRLPPEADKILEDFYINDPIEVMATYAKKAAARIEYASRFGQDSSKLKEMFDQMAVEGVASEDIEAIRDMFNVVVGRNPTRLPPGVNNLASAIHAIWGTVALLPRAVLSSLAESLTAGIVMENPAYGVKAFAKLIEGALGTKDAVERREIARFIGLVEAQGAADVLMNRFGGQYGDVTRWDRYAGRMFYNTGLAALTRAQHTHLIGPAHAYLDALAGRIVRGLDGGKGNAPAEVGTRARKDMDDALARYRELGIRDPEAFARMIRMTGRLPSIEELSDGMTGANAYAQDWITAIDRIKDQVVQNPSVMDRPRAASSAVGRLAYGIMAFNYAFWRNILKGSAIRAYERAQRSGWGYSAEKVAFGLLPAFAALLLAQTVISTVREYYTNRKRWNERQAAGTLENELIWLGVTRTFGTPMDPLVQGFTGLKYQRDLTAIPVGPALGNMAQNISAIAMPLVRNSEKTNTAEYNSIRGIYRLGVGPAIGLGLSALPGGPVASSIYGAGTAYATSPVAGDEFATMFVGEKDRRGHRRNTDRDQRNGD